MIDSLLLTGQVLCQYLVDSVLAALCGLLLAGYWIEHRHVSEGDETRTYRFLPALRWSALALLLSLSVQFWLLTMAMAGVSAPTAIVHAMPDVATTHAGKVTLSMLSVSVLLAATLFYARRTLATVHSALAVALLAAIYIAHAGLGHAASDGDFTRAELLQVLHLAGMGIWTGGVFVSAFLAVPRLESAPAPQFIAYLRRLSSISAWSASTAIFTGAVKGWIAISARLANLAQPGWSRILLVKLFFVCVALVLGFFHRRSIHQANRAWNSGEKRTLVWTLRIEAVCLALVILLSAWLSNTDPPE